MYPDQPRIADFQRGEVGGADEGEEAEDRAVEDDERAEEGAEGRGRGKEEGRGRGEEEEVESGKRLGRRGGKCRCQRFQLKLDCFAFILFFILT